LNPLLDFTSLPRFSDILPEHVNPAIEQLIAEARAAISVATQAESVSWATVVEPMQDATERLGRAWGAVAHLNAVISSPALRDAHNAALPKVTQFYTEVGLNRGLFERYKALDENPVGLTDEQRALIHHEVRDFRLSGVELEGAARERYAAIQDLLAETQSKFEDNVLDATNAFFLDVPERELKGLPADVIATARSKAADAKLDASVFRLTLQAPCFLPVMQYAESSALRAQMYRANATRASDEGDAKFDNGGPIESIVALRDEEAKLLGFTSFAELSLVPKMADSPAQVLDFIRDIAQRAKPFAERDLAELKAFALRDLGINDLQSPDVMFASEKLREKRYAFSDEALRQYFPEDRVITGLFRVVERIYSLKIVEQTASSWHPDVRFFEVRDDNGQCIGEFYFDLYARDNKRGGAWADSARDRRRRGGEQGALQTPVAYMTCNFAAPVGGKPALFTHDDVITLFHEFGHGLHLLLTEVATLGVSGFGHVEWDAVELPSQFMENYCWEWDVLSHMTQHADTGEPLPRELFDKMIAAKNFQSGLATLRQMEFSLFDMRLHAENCVANRAAVLNLLADVRAEIAVITPPAYNRMPWSFAHIFGGGYAAGYYSYKWAEVLSADAFSRFEEEGVLSPIAGSAFRHEVLGRGGSRDATTNFVAFRGRPPKVDALLRHNGMVTI
jgi:oligopeptidase A